MLKDRRNAPVTGATSTAIDAYETALHQLNLYIGDPVATIDGALAKAPEFAMGHALRAYLLLSGMEKDLIPEAQKSIAAMRGLKLNGREMQHFGALIALADGAFHLASRRLEDITAADPHDILALQMGHLLDFYRGDSRNIRDRIARAMPSWWSDMPGFHAVCGMYAFGLEETGDYAKAETFGRRAVDLEPRDGWGHHAVAHVLEMTGRFDEGAGWMEEGSTSWAPDSFFARHNWWHLALFRLEQDDVKTVLGLYDGAIKGGQSSVVLDMVDASALLWRLKLRGVDLGDRWQGIAQRWVPRIGDRLYAFNDVHAAMALIGAGKMMEARALVTTLSEVARAETDNGAMTRDVGLPLAQGFLAFAEGEYDRVVDFLRPVRNLAARFGGSHAQRDIIDLTLIEAAKREGDQTLVGALANERIELKPHSPLAHRYRRAAMLLQAA